MRLDTQKTVLGFLTLIVIASGCAQTQTDDGEVATNPVQVTEFSATPDPTPADSKVNFRVQMENTGDVDATDAAVRIFGPTFAAESGSDAGDRTWKSENGNQMNSVGNRSYEIGTIRAPSSSNPPIPATQTITLTSPNYGEDRVVTDRFNLETFFQYNTSATTELVLMEEERFRESGGTTNQLSLDNTAGPIQLDIRGTSPRVYYGDDGGDNEICLIVTNDGPGNVFIAEGVGGEGAHVGTREDGASRYYEVNSSNEDQVEVSIQDVGNVEFIKPKETDPQADPNDYTVDLIDGRGIACYGWELTDTSLQQPERTVNIQVEAEYGYSTEGSTTVTVEGRR